MSFWTFYKLCDLYLYVPITLPDSRALLIDSTVLASLGQRLRTDLLVSRVVVRPSKDTRSFVRNNSFWNSLSSCSLKQSCLIITRAFRRFILSYSSQLDSFVILCFVIKLPRNFRKVTRFSQVWTSSQVLRPPVPHLAMSSSNIFGISLTSWASCRILCIWSMLVTSARRTRRFIASKSARISLTSFPYLRLYRIGVLHSGQTLYLISASSFPVCASALSLPSIHLSSCPTSTTWPQSTSSMNIAPDALSRNSTASQTRHNLGQISPQTPTHTWPHGNSLEHGSSHLGRSQISPQRLVHLWCGHCHKHSSKHGWQGSPQLRSQIWWSQWLRHFDEQGGQDFTHLSTQVWPQKSVRLHGDRHGKWRRPPWHRSQ